MGGLVVHQSKAGDGRWSLKVLLFPKKIERLTLAPRVLHIRLLVICLTMLPTGCSVAGSVDLTTDLHAAAMNGDLPQLRPATNAFWKHRKSKMLQAGSGSQSQA